MKVLVIWAALSAGTIWGQGTTATISGSVTDPSGAAIAGAKITATSLETNVSRTGSSQADGGYSLLFLPIGTYKSRGRRERVQEIRADRDRAGSEPQRACGRRAAGGGADRDGGGEGRCADGGDHGAGARPDGEQHGNREHAAGESRRVHAAHPDCRRGYHRAGERQLRRAHAGDVGQRVAQFGHRFRELQPERRQQYQRPAQYRQRGAESGRDSGVPRDHQQLPGGRRAVRRRQRDHGDEVGNQPGARNAV